MLDTYKIIYGETILALIVFLKSLSRQISVCVSRKDSTVTNHLGNQYTAGSCDNFRAARLPSFAPSSNSLLG